VPGRRMMVRAAANREREARGSKRGIKDHAINTGNRGDLNERNHLILGNPQANPTGKPEKTRAMNISMPTPMRFAPKRTPKGPGGGQGSEQDRNLEMTNENQ